MTSLIVNILGWTGTVAVLVAYWLATTGRVQARSYAFQAINLYGAVGLVSVSLYYHVLPNVALNVVWAGIGLTGIYSIWRQHRRWLDQQPDPVLCDLCGDEHVPNGIGPACLPVDEW